jgi:hypothetical protein
MFLITAEAHYASAQTQISLSKYQNPRMGITFSYPNNLSIMSQSCFKSEGSGCRISLLYDTTILTCDECEKGIYAGGVTVLKLKETFQNQSACNCDELPDFVRWDYNNNRMSYANTKLVKESSAMVGGNHSAWQMEILDDVDTKKELIVWTINNNNNMGYVFSYSYSDLGNHDYDKYLPVFRDMLNSVKFTQIVRSEN